MTFKGWYELDKQVNITVNNVSITEGIPMGLNGGYLKIPNAEGILGNTTKVKINGQVANFIQTISTYSLF